MITVIDYGVGNIGSVLNMLEYLGLPGRVARTVGELQDATAAILPGVGSFDGAVAAFEQAGLREPLLKKLTEPEFKLLGICIGMQMLCEGSEEGELPGLGVIPGVELVVAVPANGAIGALAAA